MTIRICPRSYAFKVALALLAGMAPLSVADAAPFAFSYGGRLADDQGRGVAGPVNLEVRFWTAPTGGTDSLGRALSFTNIPLDDGVFEVDASASQLPPADMQRVFKATADTWVEVRDVTHGIVYPRQRLSAVPFALKVPVDGKTVSYDQNGNLTLLAGAATPGQVLTTDAGGNLAWGSPAGSGSVTSVMAGNGLSISGGASGITTSGTLNVNTGTAANQIVQIGGDGKLPAVDGSKLTGISAANVTTGVLPLTSGGTGAASAAAARGALQAAASGANADITALTGLTTPLNAAQGGTGSAGFSPGSVIFAGATALTEDHSSLYWNSASKRLGIGTTAPAATLDVFDNTNQAKILVEVGSGASLPPMLSLLDGRGSGHEFVLASSSGYFVLNDATASNATRLSVDPMGNVGIGTSSPAKLMHLSSANSNNTTLRLENTSSFETWDLVTAGSSNPDGGSNFFISDGVTPRMTITPTGNVGIGTTNPQTTLDVSGAMRLTVNTNYPFTCSPPKDGAIALTHQYTTCVCKGGASTWVQTSDGTTTCTW